MPSRRTGPSLEFESVSDLARRLRGTLEGAYPDLWVKGEISGMGRGPTGHWYFDIKDAKAQLRCVMFRSYAQSVAFPPEDGDFVRLRATVTVYEPRGSMQLKAVEMHFEGEGALRRAIEALRRRLESEGLFDDSRKRALPSFPGAVGVVTSGHGAARHDIRRVVGERFPNVRLILCPVRVQGAGAAREIARAVEAFNALPKDDARRPDVLIVGRGGGSLEDLAAFNEEIVARALFASRIPTISAVGHENDVSIADFVADVRAATPSNAAELVVPDRRAVAALFFGLHDRLRVHMVNSLRRRRDRIGRLVERLSKAENLLLRGGQRLDELTLALARGGERRLLSERNRLDALRHRLEALDPRRPLERGFVRVERLGRPVRAAAGLVAGDRVVLHFRDDAVAARIEEKTLFT